MHYSEVIKTMLVPEKELGSVIDTLNSICDMLEKRETVKNGGYVSCKDVDTIILNGLFVLGFYPFFRSHGHVLRPLLIMALESKGSAIPSFLTEAIPCALTIFMPQNQDKYTEYRNATIAKLQG